MLATASRALRRRCRSWVAALAASSWLASSTIGNPCVWAGRPARGLVAADQREQLAHRAEALERGRDGRILLYRCHAKCRQALTVPAAPARSQYCSPGASSRRPAGRRAASCLGWSCLQWCYSRARSLLLEQLPAINIYCPAHRHLYPKIRVTFGC